MTLWEFLQAQQNERYLNEEIEALQQVRMLIDNFTNLDIGDRVGMINMLDRVLARMDTLKETLTAKTKAIDLGQELQVKEILL